ncbi:MAG: OmpA family protein [Oscillatoria sp. SIO1A7]|nr:OmpA family protein [Oscillatoria sp. SIO1A7]
MAKSRVDNSNSVNQLEGLLNLLVDLEIANANQKDSALAKQQSNETNGSSVTLEGSTQKPLESNRDPEAAPEPISSEINYASELAIDRLQSLLLDQEGDRRSEPELPPPNQNLEERLQSLLLEEDTAPPPTTATDLKPTPRKKASRGRLQRILIEAEKKTRQSEESATTAPPDSKYAPETSSKNGSQSSLQERPEEVSPISSEIEEDLDKRVQIEDSSPDGSIDGKEPEETVPLEPLEQQEAANSPELKPNLELEATVETPLQGQLVDSYSSETVMPIPWGEVKLENRESASQNGKRRRLQRMLLQLEKIDREKYAASKQKSKQLEERLADEEIRPKIVEPAPPKLDEKELAVALSRLQQELVDPELTSLRQLIALMEQKMAYIEGQLYEPTDLINPLLPLIAQILESQADDSKKDIFDEMVPIIDRVIWERSQQDRKAMSRALASLIPEAISQHIGESPDAVANALGPAMGRAIKEQIRLERDAMVDALYPVIGNTISKYMAEVVNSINDRVENALSVKGVTRKLRAKMQGVSEAELILQESMPFTVKAIFLIHKGSGLVIAEAQKMGNEEMESDMIAGMLTAIRSFANDCMTQSGKVSELNEIEYDNFKLILEVAGYCYMAVVSTGQASKQFLGSVRQTMSKIVQNYGQPIESFEGDTDTIPEAVGGLLTALMEAPAKLESRKNKPPIALLALGATVFLGIGIFGIVEASDRRLEKQVISAWNSTPELAVYPTEVDANRGKLTLAGKVPNQRLRQKAFLVAADAVPNRQFENNIVAVEVPPDPVKVAQEVKRITAVLNQRPGVAIAATYIGNRVKVEGKVPEPKDTERITAAFAQIPGVASVTNSLKIEELILATRIYFDPGSSILTPGSYQTELLQIQQFLSQYPETDLRIIGHTDLSGTLEANLKVARERASVVKQALVKLGIAPERLQITSTATPPPDKGSTQPLWMSRCVRFLPVSAP